MLNIFLVIQFAITLLLILSVIIQRTGRQTLGGIDAQDTSGAGTNFIVRVTWVLVILFFLNSILLGNIAARKFKDSEIITIDTIIDKSQKPDSESNIKDSKQKVITRKYNIKKAPKIKRNLTNKVKKK